MPDDYAASPPPGTGEAMMALADRAKQYGRKAFDAPQAWAKALGSPKNLLRAGVATAAIPALLELADGERPLDEKLARAGGSLAGMPLATATFFATGGPANPLSYALAALAAAAGSQGGAGLAEAGLNALKGSETDRATREFLKQQQAVATAKAREMETLLPVQQQAAELRLSNLEKENEIDARRMLGLATLQAMQDQQRGNQNLVSQIGSGLMSPGSIGYGI